MSAPEQDIDANRQAIQYLVEAVEALVHGAPDSPEVLRARNALSLARKAIHGVAAAAEVVPAPDVVSPSDKA